MESSTKPSTLTGEIFFLYAFDVASEIKTTKIREVLNETASSLRIKLDRSAPKDVPFYKPLVIEVPKKDLSIQGLPATIQVRIYEVGVVSVAVRVPFKELTTEELRTFHDPKSEQGIPLDVLALKVSEGVVQDIYSLLIKPNLLSEPEAYTVFCVTKIDELAELTSWLPTNERAVAALLNATSKPDALSPSRVQEVMRVKVSFENNDLVVIDWNAAIVIDLDGYVDEALYVLEIANLQIQEFRALDAQLDRDLDYAYDVLESESLKRLARSRKTLKQLKQMRVDFTKLADEISHIGKFFGDWYLGKVYLGARERFYLEAWRQSIDTRLERLDQIYSVVHSNIYDRRMLMMELIIVVLFIADLLAIFLNPKA